MSDDRALVSVQGLTKRFALRTNWRDNVFTRSRKMVTAVDNVSFDVAEGEVFGLLGQNGAGKTTIFRMLTTMIIPDAGAARVAGFDVVEQGAKVRRVIAPVAANERSLYWRLSARENVDLFAALQGLAGAEADQEATRVLGIVGLTDTGEKMVGAFSSGMRQRLLIARALLGRPRVLLLDEPTRSLDPISARDFRRFLRDTIVREQRCTVLLATHDAEEVWDLCDRVGVLERGQLLEVDVTSVLRDRAGTDRFRAWVRSGDSAAAADRAQRAGVEFVRKNPAAEAGWDELEFEIPGGASAAARALSAIANGADGVARFERVSPSLADLIERVVARRAGAADA